MNCLVKEKGGWGGVYGYKNNKFIQIVVPAIGFINTPYTVNEDDGMVTMMIGILSDGLKIEVSLMISLLSGSLMVSL